ncbi:hypothetical protein CAPI_02160 [Corynebacterium capitovis DSM 44611]|uniref:hypothetical protein n=1 Tax=Corynebacterium capitovis TaxID=131081 RepID=UPI00035DE502|nr:hypothetical protein [Corynebacterium capitovis]WKD57006.1 hypothetical protein CAPI_02160 [Corynebacterium capitovis DSM 44611]
MLRTLLPASIAIWVAWTGVRTYQQKTRSDEATELWRRRDEWLSNMRWAVEQTQSTVVAQEEFGWRYLRALLEETDALASSDSDWILQISQLLRDHINVNEDVISIELERKRVELQVAKRNDLSTFSDEGTENT